MNDGLKSPNLTSLCNPTPNFYQMFTQFILSVNPKYLGGILASKDQSHQRGHHLHFFPPWALPTPREALVGRGAGTGGLSFVLRGGAEA